MAGRTYTAWAHGVAAMPENPEIPVRRQGFGVTFTIPAGCSEWIHLPVPTPAMVADARAALERVQVLFDARDACALTAVHVHDGPERILLHEDMKVEGDHSRGLDAMNVFPVARADIRFGVAISLLIAAGPVDGGFFLTGFGGEFRYELP